MAKDNQPSSSGPQRDEVPLRPPPRVPGTGVGQEQPLHGAPTIPGQAAVNGNPSLEPGQERPLAPAPGVPGQQPEQPLAGPVTVTPNQYPTLGAERPLAAMGLPCTPLAATTFPAAQAVPMAQPVYPADQPSMSHETPASHAASTPPPVTPPSNPPPVPPPESAPPAGHESEPRGQREWAPAANAGPVGRSVAAVYEGQAATVQPKTRKAHRLRADSRRETSQMAFLFFLGAGLFLVGVVIVLVISMAH